MPRYKQLLQLTSCESKIIAGGLTRIRKQEKQSFDTPDDRHINVSYKPPGLNFFSVDAKITHNDIGIKQVEATAKIDLVKLVGAVIKELKKNHNH